MKPKVIDYTMHNEERFSTVGISTLMKQREFEQASTDIEQATKHEVILDFESNDDGEIGSNH